MSIELATTSLPVTAVRQAAAIQARAFFDDPLFTFVFPDRKSRLDRLAWLMQVGIGYGVRFGKVHTSAGAMLGHAVWLPPGETDVTPERLEDTGFVDPVNEMGEMSYARFGAFMEQVAPVHARLVPEPHWYLMILGVDPPAQGQGVGGALMEPVLARADAEGLRCYLETARERNLSFYQKHGFQVVETIDMADGGPRIWTMLRQPR